MMPFVVMIVIFIVVIAFVIVSVFRLVSMLFPALALLIGMPGFSGVWAHFHPYCSSNVSPAAQVKIGASGQRTAYQQAQQYLP